MGSSYGGLRILITLSGERSEIGRDGVVVGVEGEVERGEIVSGLIERLGIHRAQPGEVERLEEHPLQIADSPGLVGRGRNSQEDGLRREAVGRVELESDAGGFLRVRDDLHPFVDEQPGQWLLWIDRTGGLHHQRQPAPGDLLAGLERQAHPAIGRLAGFIGLVRELSNGELQILAGVQRFGVTQRCRESRDAVANARAALKPGDDGKRIVVLNLVAVAKRLGELIGVARGETRQDDERFSKGRPHPFDLAVASLVWRR